MQTLLLKGLSYLNVIEDINLEFTSGKIHAILGPNGAGKSTLFKNIVGILQANSGEIRYNSLLINKLSIEQRVNTGIAYLPQGKSIFQGLTIRENLYIAQEKVKCNNEHFQQVIDNFELSSILNTRGDKLSGGQRRRAEIARCMILQPSFLLLDEPFAGIDPKTIGQIQKILANIADKGTGIIITDHQAEKTIDMAHKVTILSKGTVLVTGLPTEIKNNRQVLELYLGHS